MILLQIFDFFLNEANDRAWWPLPPDNPESIPLLASAVYLSGMMHDCQNVADIQEAVAHTLSLIDCGIFTKEEWAAKSVAVDGAMEQYMNEMRETLKLQAERN